MRNNSGYLQRTVLRDSFGRLFKKPQVKAAILDEKITENFNEKCSIQRGVFFNAKTLLTTPELYPSTKLNLFVLTDLLQRNSALMYKLLLINYNFVSNRSLVSLIHSINALQVPLNHIKQYLRILCCF